MVEIPEHKRDDSKDYLKVLKALNEIPFPVGRNLLADFLMGDAKNKSIKKNDLEEYYNFGSLDFLTKQEVISLIQNLIINGFIDSSPASFNKFIKVLSISKKGQEELLNPGMNKKPSSESPENQVTEITEKEEELFENLGDFLEGFNREQKKAIVNENNSILCIAGAGSGKTSVLTKRIEHLYKYKKIEGKKILAITFTRKARIEMYKRLEEKGISDVKVETFNSFCEKMLQKNQNLIYGKEVKVAGYKDKLEAIMKALENQGMSIEDAIDKYFSNKQKKNKTKYQLQNMFMGDCFSVLDYFKTKNKDLEKIKENISEENKEISELIYDIVKYLDEHMALYGLRTYNDQLNDCISFFRKNPEKIPGFEHILVDEYQDVNAKQIELLDLLNGRNLFAVGDPRQSIFGWRGSDVNYILEFKEKYPDSEIINLKKNYRSNSHIVEVMNKSIRDMKMPDLEASFEKGKDAELFDFDDEIEEMNFVADKIFLSSIPKEEIFVLARTNRQLEEMSKVLKRKNISHILRNENSRNAEIKKGYVTLSTIHSIKGMEAEMVFVIGCNSTNLPCKTSENPVMDMIKMYEYDKEEEEKRLFYVAISRAKNYLYITYSGKCHTYFIDDEMKDLLEY